MRSRPKIVKTEGPNAAVKGRRSSRDITVDAAQSLGDNPTAAATSNLSFEELVKKRVNGEVKRTVWTQYLNSLPTHQARKEAKDNFQVIAKAIQRAQSQEAKIRHKATKELAKVKLSNFMAIHKHFPKLYETVVQLFSAALKQDKETLTKDKKLPSTALSGKWAPTIDGDIDLSTSLGKNIARSLYSSKFTVESEWTLNDKKKAYSLYRKEYLTPLRAYVHVPETLMSNKKWSEINYERVPSVSMKRNKEQFLKHDTERFTKFLEEVKTGAKKIASGALLPHEIIEQLLSSEDYRLISSYNSNSSAEGGSDETTPVIQLTELEKVAELQWTSYIENLKKSGTFESALSICDVSGMNDRLLI